MGSNFNKKINKPINIFYTVFKANFDKKFKIYCFGRKK